MPNRILRDWTTSETIDKLSQGAEVFFTRLIMKADDFGNYTANTKLLKAALFPLKDYSEDQINDWLGECINLGIVLAYTVETKEFINIPNFGQRLRAMKHAFPRPAANSLTSGGQLADKWRPETKGNEVETNMNLKTINIFGDKSEPLFFRIQDKTVNAPITMLYGMKGWADFLAVQSAIIQYPEHAPKFLKKNHAYQFYDRNHLHNSYMKFIENIYK